MSFATDPDPQAERKKIKDARTRARRMISVTVTAFDL
jgi:hypothetical protein